MFSGGGFSGSNVIGISPSRLPEMLSVYITVSPSRMVDVEPLAAWTWYVLPDCLSLTVWCRSPMSVPSETTYFRTFFVVPLAVRTSTTPL